MAILTQYASFYTYDKLSTSLLDSFCGISLHPWSVKNTTNDLLLNVLCSAIGHIVDDRPFTEIYWTWELYIRMEIIVFIYCTWFRLWLTQYPSFYYFININLFLVWVPYLKIKVELSRFAVHFCFGVKCFDTMQETGTHTFYMCLWSLKLL